ncbi:MAG: hypothetical protein IM547_02425 [Chitinophagaceae bacterium]|nr:hypothetical protein [Chitinophagaceae bacterium]
MKKSLHFFVLVFLTTSTFSQSTDISKIGLYRWTEVVFIKPCDIEGKDLTNEPSITSMVGQKFRVLKMIDGTNALIQILDYIEPQQESKKQLKENAIKDQSIKPKMEFFKYNYRGTESDFASLGSEKVKARNYGTKQAYFKVSITLIERFSTKESYNYIAGSLAAGVINFPFKFRPQKGVGDFSGAFNFGAGIGYTFRHKSSRLFSHSVISGYSISNIILDSSSTNKNQGKLSSTNNFSAFSFSLGYLIQYQTVQAGIFIGWDRISRVNQNTFDWNFQGKPWLSVGFGLTIFSGQKEKGKTKDDAIQDVKN